MSVAIRDESEADRAAIHALVAAALGPAEAGLVDALRAESALLLSLAAFDGEALVGHVAISRLAIEAGRAGVLAPLAVAAKHQRRGIASGLVTAALERRRAAGDDAMLVLGDPAFYGRFGFSAALAKPFRTPWDGPHQQAVAFSEAGARLRGTVRYPRAFAELD